MTPKPPKSPRPKFRTVHVQPSEQGESDNPDHFGLLVFLTFIIWPIGLVASVVYLCDPKRRGAGFALLAISSISATLAWFLIQILRH